MEKIVCIYESGILKYRVKYLYAQKRDDKNKDNH